MSMMMYAGQSLLQTTGSTYTDCKVTAIGSVQLSKEESRKAVTHATWNAVEEAKREVCNSAGVEASATTAATAIAAAITQVRTPTPPSHSVRTSHSPDSHIT
jgi:hypothetical protein